MKIELNLIDVTGKKIKNLIKEERNRGSYEYILNYTDLDMATGIYFVELINTNDRRIIKTVFIK